MCPLAYRAALEFAHVLLVHKSQEAGKGTGKWRGEGEKPLLSTLYHLVLISTLLIFGFKTKKLATAGNVERCFVRKIR